MNIETLSRAILIVSTFKIAKELYDNKDFIYDKITDGATYFATKTGIKKKMHKINKGEIKKKLKKIDKMARKKMAESSETQDWQ